MALEYIVPRIAIDESDTGTNQDITPVSLSRIGIVGTFCRGPVNTPTVVNYDQAVGKFGGYIEGLTGYLSLLGARAQGADDFVIARVGGDSIASAAKTLLDAASGNSVVITAATPGTWGNDIYVAAAAGTNSGTFKLIVTYGTTQETFDNLTLDTVGSLSSAYIKAVKASGATAIPAVVASSPLLGGNDGAVTDDADYVGAVDAAGNRTGLKALEGVYCAIVICAQQYSTTIRNALLAHCANADAAIDYGLRVSVLSTAAGIAPATAVLETAAMDSMRGILAYPWYELSDLPGILVAPDGAYAGALATGAANDSPSNRQLYGISKMERALAPDEVKALTQARISPITAVYNRGFRVRNGLTLAQDDDWSQTNIRRAFDQLEMEIYNRTYWALSKNNTAKLRAAVAAQIDNYLAEAKTNEEIYDFKPTVCDDTNNTAETVAARKLNTTIRVRPTFAADYIDHTIQRLLDTE